MPQKRYWRNNQGFTLIELLVVILVLALIGIVALTTLDPFGQFARAKDARRKADMTQIKSALDLYYQDHHCYPTTLSFGSSFVDGSTVYMTKVPQDPDCNTKSQCYAYQTDTTSSCPQWNVIYAHLMQKLTIAQAKISCPTYNACPGLLYGKFNFCLMSGDIDCTYMRLPGNAPTFSTPTPTPIPTPTSTSNPVGGGGVCSCATAQYDIRGTCNHVSGGANYCDSLCTVHCTP